MLTFIRETPEQALTKLIQEVRLTDSKFDFRPFFSMTPSRIDEEIEKIEAGHAAIYESVPNRTWLNDPGYIQSKRVHEALGLIKKLREEYESNEELVPGMTYYRGVKQFGDRLEGLRCTVMEGHEPAWIKFSESVAVNKALTVLRYGNDDDFRHIYMELANGRPESLMEISVEHVSESTPEALALIETYCDSRWDGAWMFEARPPLRLNSKIEENTKMRKLSLAEMRGRFDEIARKLFEGEMEKYEVIASISDMEKVVDSMIGDLGKLSSAGIETSAAARMIAGDEVGSHIEQALQPVLSSASQALSNLKSQLSQARSSIEGASGAPAGGDMGSPLDAMGAPPGQDGGLADDLAAADLNGMPDERPMKAA